MCAEGYTQPPTASLLVAGAGAEADTVFKLAFGSLDPFAAATDSQLPPESEPCWGSRCGRRSRASTSTGQDTVNSESSACQWTRQSAASQLTMTLYGSGLDRGFTAPGNYVSPFLLEGNPG
jgi:hypothetical protein